MQRRWGWRCSCTNTAAAAAANSASHARMKSTCLEAALQTARQVYWDATLHSQLPWNRRDLCIHFITQFLCYVFSVSVDDTTTTTLILGHENVLQYVPKSPAVYIIDVKKRFYVFYSCHVFYVLTFFYFFNVFIIKNVSKKINEKPLWMIRCYDAFLLTYILSGVHREKLRTGSNGVLRANVAEMWILFDTFTLMLFLYVSLTLVQS